MWVSTSQPEQSQHLSIHNGYTDTGEKFSGEVVEVNVKLSWTLLFNTKRFCRCLNTVDTCPVTGRDCGYYLAAHKTENTHNWRLGKLITVSASDQRNIQCPDISGQYPINNLLVHSPPSCRGAAELSQYCRRAEQPSNQPPSQGRECDETWNMISRATVIFDIYFF